VPGLATIGSLSRDRVDGEERVGGGAFHAARALRLLEAPAVVVTRAADRTLLPPLVALGVPVRFRESRATAGFSLAYDGEERTMLLDEVGDAWTPEDVDGWVGEALAGVRWLHVAPLARSDFPPETLAALARGRHLLLDGQGLVRRPQPGPLELDADFDRDALRHVSTLKLAEQEAAVLLPDFEAASLASLGVPEVLVTLASRGSLVFADGRVEHVPARAVDGDATGAGDAFCAVYLAARACGQPPLAAARRATALVEALLLGAR